MALKRVGFEAYRIFNRIGGWTGHRNSPAIYLEILNVLIEIKMRGEVLLNSLKTLLSAHFWPHLREENCDPMVNGFRL
jgi:hypothetical protein